MKCDLQYVSQHDHPFTQHADITAACVPAPASKQMSRDILLRGYAMCLCVSDHLRKPSTAASITQWYLGPHNPHTRSRSRLQIRPCCVRVGCTPIRRSFCHSKAGVAATFRGLAWAAHADVWGRVISRLLSGRALARSPRICDSRWGVAVTSKKLLCAKEWSL